LTCALKSRLSSRQAAHLGRSPRGRRPIDEVEAVRCPGMAHGNEGYRGTISRGIEPRSRPGRGGQWSIPKSGLLLPLVVDAIEFLCTPCLLSLPHRSLDSNQACFPCLLSSSSITFLTQLLTRTHTHIIQTAFFLLVETQPSFRPGHAPQESTPPHPLLLSLVVGLLVCRQPCTTTTTTQEERCSGYGPR